MSSLYNPAEMKARVPFPAGIVSYRTKSDGGKGDKHMWAVLNYLDAHGVTCYCGLMVRTENWEKEWYGKMYQAKFAIIMMSDSYWEPGSPCRAEVEAILQRGIPIFSLRVDDSCHTCMRGDFLGGSIEEITAAGFLKAKLGSLNVFPPPHKQLFQDDFAANAAELVDMIRAAVDLGPGPAGAAHGAGTPRALADGRGEPEAEASAGSPAVAGPSAGSTGESLAGHLDAVKLGAYAAAIAKEGYDEVQFLVDADAEGIDEMLASV